MIIGTFLNDINTNFSSQNEYVNCSLSPPEYQEPINTHETLSPFKLFCNQEEENSLSRLDFFSDGMTYRTEIPVKSNNLEGKITNGATYINLLSNENESLTVFPYENVKKKLSEFGFPINNSSKEDSKLKRAEEEMKFLGKKKRFEKSKSQPKRGRKPIKEKKKMENKGESLHDEFAGDNIIKKAKGFFLKYNIKFLNSLFDMKKGKERFINLDYKNCINKIKKEEELKILDLSIKQLVSQKITSKFKKKEKDWNKKLIASLEKKNDEFIDYIFKMKYKDWINIFTLKRNVDELEIKDEWKKRIIEKMPKISDLFEEIKEKKGADYLCHFSFYALNYENWFISKKGRNKQKFII